MPRAVTLPNDIESLKQLVLERTAALEAANALLLSRQVEIDQLKLQIKQLQRMKFGRSSEQLDAQIAQLEFKLEELESRANHTCTSPPRPAPVRPAVERYARWAKMSPRCSSTCRNTGR